MVGAVAEEEEEAAVVAAAVAVAAVAVAVAVAEEEEEAVWVAAAAAAAAEPRPEAQGAARASCLVVVPMSRRSCLRSGLHLPERTTRPLRPEPTVETARARRTARSSRPVT